MFLKNLNTLKNINQFINTPSSNVTNNVLQNFRNVLVLLGFTTSNEMYSVIFKFILFLSTLKSSHSALRSFDLPMASQNSLKKSIIPLFLFEIKFFIFVFIFFLSDHLQKKTT